MFFISFSDFNFPFRPKMPIPGRNRNGCFLTVDQLLNPALAVPGRIPHFARYQDTMASAASNVVGVHYRVGKKIGEGSFGVIFEGTNLLNSQLVAIKFVRSRFVAFSQLESLHLSLVDC